MNNNDNAPQMPIKPFIVQYKDLQKELVNTIQDYTQKGFPFCVTVDILNELLAQCKNLAEQEYNQSSARYDEALSNYSEYVRSLESAPTEDAVDNAENK